MTRTRLQQHFGPPYVSPILSGVERSSGTSVLENCTRHVFVLNNETCSSQNNERLSIEKPTTHVLEIQIQKGIEKQCIWKLQLILPQLFDIQYFNLYVTNTANNSDNITMEIMEDTGEKHEQRILGVESSKVDFASTSGNTSFFIHIPRLAHPTSLIVHLWLSNGDLIRKLPTVWLSPRYGYVTSPGFDGTYNTFPVYTRYSFENLLNFMTYTAYSSWRGYYANYTAYYRGSFKLDVRINECVFIAFTHFRLSDSECSDFFEFEANATNTRWKKCGVQDINPQVYHSSVRVKLTRYREKSRAYPRSVGFKMMFVIMPRSQEPEQLSKGLYNCSVPNFRDFKPLLQCNHLVECADEEDEQDCHFHSEECGEGMIDAGSKCYKLYRNWKKITWWDANSKCTQHNQNLATFATSDETAFLVNLALSVKRFTGIFVGILQIHKFQSPYIVSLYNRGLWQWMDGRMDFSVTVRRMDPLDIYRPGKKNHLLSCVRFLLSSTKPLDFYKGYYHPYDSQNIKRGLISLWVFYCDDKEAFDVLCENKKRSAASKRHSVIRIVQSFVPWNASFVHCPNGHVTRKSLSCNVESNCWVKDMAMECSTGRDQPQVPMYRCQNSRQSIHFSLVCDHIPHCFDKSDETFCHFPLCPQMYKCANEQCIDPLKECNQRVDCLDGSDEKCYFYFDPLIIKTDGPSIQHMRAHGTHKAKLMYNSSDCPVTHFVCPFGDCLPLFLRCNDIADCPGREDEAGCEDYACPGFYRCLGSKVCLHRDHVCDGFWQCPLRDDEMLCNTHCPDVCHCQGLAFVCFHRFNGSFYSDLRLLDASGSDMTLTDLGDMPFLIHLNMSRCDVGSVAGLSFSNLKILDLSWNKIFRIDIESLQMLENLLVLTLANNPLSIINYNAVHLMLKLNLISIHLSNTTLQVYNSTVFAAFLRLKKLEISSSALTTITSDGFQTTPLLESLDARGSPFSVFPTDVIRNLQFLKSVRVDNYKMCCPVMLPTHLHKGNCHSKSDLLSSCENLLRSDSYRIFLWVFAFFALMGNVSSFVGRMYLQRNASNRGRTSMSGFGVFVTNLCLADGLMGIYLSVVGTSDLIYRGKYLFHDDEWKTSLTCKLAGVLSLLSSEVSAFTITLITLDRLLVIRFPFSRVRFEGCSATVLCFVMWTVGLFLATLPLLPIASHWEFFSQTGICIPLPFVSDNSFKGYTYSFAIVVVLNFILFLFIACGQVVIYWSVQASSLESSNTDHSAREATVARRLITVVLSDFLCWFPVGLLGVLGSTGTAIPGEVNVAVAVFVLPLNSALNPFLYTLNVVKEKQQKAKEHHLIKQLETRMALTQIKTWLQDNILLEQDLTQFI